MKKFNRITAVLLLGIIAVAVSQAAVPTRVTPEVTEIKATKVNAPEKEDEFSKLSAMEGKYAESWDQQQRLRAATNRVSGRSYKRPQVATRAAPAPQKKIRR